MFAIMCMRCDTKYATMQETRVHLQDCPFGKPVDIMCGHCELRVSSWSTMCNHLNQPGMQKQVARKPEYRMEVPPRPEFRQVTRLLWPPTSPLAMTVMSQTGIRQAYGEWRNPPLLTLSPSRKEARDQRHTQLRSTLLHWGRKHPGRTGLRGAEQSLPTIPLEPAPARGYRLPAAAAGAPGIWPPPVPPERRPTRPHWRLMTSGRYDTIRDAILTCARKPT